MLKRMLAAVACGVLFLCCFASLLCAAEKPSGQGNQSLQSSPFVLPIAKRDSLLNGLQLIIMEQPDSGNVTVHLRINSGGLFDLAGKGGLADLTAGMLLRGSVGLSAKSVSDMVEQLNLMVRVKVNWDSTDIVISGPKNEFDDIFDLLNRLVVTPTFDQKELEALKAQRINEVKQEATDENQRLRRKALEGLFGSYPYGRPLTGTAESLQQIGRADLLNYYSRFYIANNAQLLVQGEITADQVTQQARRRLGTWKKGEAVPPNFRQPERLTSSRILLIDRKDAPDSHAVLALMGLSRRAPDYFAAMMAADILNQLLTSASLGAAVKLEARVLPGPLTIELSAPAEKIMDEVKRITGLLARLQVQSPALEQVEAAKARLITTMGERLRTNASIAEVILDIESYGLGRDYVLHYAERVNAVTPADIQAAARSYMKPESLVIAVSGSAARIEADARKLGTVTIIR